MNALGRKNPATVAGRPGIDLGRPLRFAHGVDHHGLDLERPIQGIEVGRFPEKLIQGFKIRRDFLLDKPAFRSFAITECPDHITEIAQLGIDGRNHGHNPFLRIIAIFFRWQRAGNAASRPVIAQRKNGFLGAALKFRRLRPDS